MKKIVAFCLLFSLCILNAQEKPALAVDKVEKEVQNYISKKIKTYELTPEKKLQIRESMMHDNPDHTPLDQKLISNTELSLKEYELRKEYFENNPKQAAAYSATPAHRGIDQVCTNGGFENSVLSDYVFRRRNSNSTPSSGTSTNMVTTGADFVGITASTNVNNPTNLHATLVGPGNDPTLSASGISVPTTNGGSNRAIKLNLSIPSSGYDVVTMSRNFNINEDFFDFSYSLIAQNSANSPHPVSEQPFFEVRIYNATRTSILRSISIVPYPNDCLLQTAQNNNLLYSGWRCARINTSDLIGTDVVVEFIISDCIYGVHFGTVYIDDICSSSCSDPTFGSINLNPLPTITCPTTTQTICGTYITPQSSQYNSMTLDIIKGNSIVSTIPAPSTIIPSSGNVLGTFCFTVPVSAFGNNPNGNFEFAVHGNFDRICTLGNVALNPITDISTNNAGPDVSFINCIDAINDNATYSSCSLGSVSVLNNDTIYGNPISITNVILTQTSPVIPQLTLDTVSGVVNVTLGTPPGTYSLTYNICNISNPTHCDAATVTIVVNGITIDAVNNDFSATPFNACQGGNTTSVFVNDQLCGSAINPALVTTSLVMPVSIPGASITNAGNIIIPPGTTPGNYTLTYKICQNASPTNCDTATVNIVIAQGALPTFSILSTLCYGTTAPVLPTTSINGISGTWSPTVVSNIAPGSYTFTPTGQCSASVTINITILQQCGFALSWGSAINCQLASGLDPRKSYDPDISGGQCIRICENSTVAYTLMGPTGIIHHTNWVVTGGNIVTSSTTNTVCTIQWGTANFCALQGTIFLTNGTQITINKCIEKIKAPKALFGVRPDVSATVITTCVNNTVSFENLTTNNGGNDMIYYNWDFGDGIGTSTEFEPSYSYTHNGDYEVKLTAFNGCSCSSVYTIKVRVRDQTIPITCPSVVCEGERATYAVNPEMSDQRCQINWVVVGGHIVSPSQTNIQIDVVWDHVDDDGFGYLYANSDQCLKCTSSVKVPVVKQHGVIKGSASMCTKSQSLYSLPQWPSTEFNWTINDHGLGALLYTTNQRNEIIVQSSADSGYIDIYCTYTNTLLGCGGNAQFRIFIKPNVELRGNRIVCKNNSVSYAINDSNGNPINSIDWSISGPNNFLQNGSSAPFSITFPAVGLYYFTINSTDYCPSKLVEITVTESPATPAAITGPAVICPGSPETYSVPPVAGTITHWTIPNNNGTIYGSATGNQILVSFNPTATTPYVLSVYYEADGCNSGSRSITLNRVVPDLTLIHNDATVCGSNTGTYTINDIQAESYLWTIEPQSAGSVQSGQNSPSVVILWNQTAQTAYVKLKVRKCGKDYEKLPNGYPVTITNSPTVTLAPVAPTCSGLMSSTQFTLNPASSFTNVTWNFGDGSTPQTFNSPSNTVSHIYNNAQTNSANYTITATVNGAGGCLMPSTASTTAVVSPAPVVDISPKSNLNVCNPNNIPSDYVYSVNIQSGFIPTQSIQWYHNGSLIPGANASTITIPPTGIGTYYAVVTNTLQCSSSTAVITVFSNCGDSSCTSTNPIDAAITQGCQSFTATAIITGSPINVFWSNTYFPGATILQNGNSVFQAENIEPGQYNIQIHASYNEGGNICYAQKHIPFIIPYKADLKYITTCASGGAYSVQLLDHSVYYDSTPIQLYEFTTDNGLTWQSSTPAAGINQLIVPLTPGLHYVGIRISRTGYASCQKIIPIVLPPFPNATFTNSNNNCQGTAVNFFATSQPGCQYLWNFGNSITNLQQNPVRTFDGAGINIVTLTVTNEYGCSSSSTQPVSVTAVNMAGTLAALPANICQGNPSGVTLAYTPSAGTATPTHYYWYNTSNTITPFTDSSSPSTIVNATGQYYVYTEDANHCMNYKTSSATAAFIPLPDSPTIFGKSSVCAGSTFNIRVPQNSAVQYQWFLNGTPQPQWFNAHEIYDSQNSGTYTYSVVAQTIPNGGVSCSSAPATFTVTVLDTPDVPEIVIHEYGCEPYYVTVNVANPQSGVSYYWSNGNTGTQAHITHDGPLQVSAVANDCSSEAQIDLPLDLNTLTWIFPKGCYIICKEDHLGYIIGPLGEYAGWAWLKDDHAVVSGAGSVDPFTGVEPTNNFQLFLANGYCRIKTDYMDVTEKECDKCAIIQEVKSVECSRIGAYFIYQVQIIFDNPYGSDVWTTITVPNNEGYFVNSTILLPPGVSTQTFSFYVLNNFTGGAVNVKITGHWKQKDCMNKFTINFPELCGKNPRLDPNESEIDNLLILAPNPTSANTTALYQYVDGGKDVVKTIEIRDALGRILMTEYLEESKGAKILDCSRFASGQYYILMKANGKVIKNTKLMISY